MDKYKVTDILMALGSKVHIVLFIGIAKKKDVKLY
jgi:hypothetical protein